MPCTLGSALAFSSSSSSLGAEVRQVLALEGLQQQRHSRESMWCSGTKHPVAARLGASTAAATHNVSQRATFSSAEQRTSAIKEPTRHTPQRPSLGSGHTVSLQSGRSPHQPVQRDHGAFSTGRNPSGQKSRGRRMLACDRAPVNTVSISSTPSGRRCACERLCTCPPRLVQLPPSLSPPPFPALSISRHNTHQQHAQRQSIGQWWKKEDKQRMETDL